MNINLKQIIIEEINKYILSEANYNYHYSRYNKDIQGYGEPYTSENRFSNSHETGHFGSGTYFSTYKFDKSKSKDIESKDNKNKDTKTPEFIKIADGLYRADFDLYKNLYTPKDYKEAKLLYDTLSTLDGMFNVVNENINTDEIEIMYYNIYKNSDSLNINVPNYNKLIKMMKDYYKSNNKQSFGTYIMELNGYNGVNVSGIEYFDNTFHGSVVYDLSKTSIEKVNFRKEKMEPFENSDLFDEVLKNGVTERNYYTLKKLPFTTLKKLIKSYIQTPGSYADIESIIKLEDTFNGIIEWFLSLFNNHAPYELNKKLKNANIISEIYNLCGIDCFNLIINNYETLISNALEKMIQLLSDDFMNKIETLKYSGASEIINNVIPELQRKPTQYEIKLVNELLTILNNLKTNNIDDKNTISNTINLINNWIK